MNERLDIAGDLGQAKILVIDDDQDARNLLKHSLEPFGHSVREAEDGEAGIDCCKAELPDLIITDVMMPNMNGHEFVERFRKIFGETFVPILMLTALTAVEQKVEGLDSGADDYLTKPFDINELVARVRALLRVKVLTEQLYERNEQL